MKPKPNWLSLKRPIRTGLFIGFLATGGLAFSQTPVPIKAFPGAEGFGAYTVGGRGGTVYKVTNLNDAGPGSLREAIEARGPRVVIFDVDGTIRLLRPLVIRNPFITIAGQTAPGEGIALADQEFRISTSQVIVRYIRARHGDISRVEGDALSITAGSNIMIDHCSASWSTDETLSISQQLTRGPDQLNNITVQWSIIAQSLDQSVHAKGAHGYGSLVRGSAGSRYSFHHNLWAHHRARMPRPGNFADAAIDPQGPLFDFTNNVFYNWGGGATSGSGYNVDETAISRYNFRNNSYRRGANSQSSLIFIESAPQAQAHFSGNFINGEAASNDVAIKLNRPALNYFQATPFEHAGLSPTPALEAEARVLQNAGASRRRDSVDARIVQDVRTQSGRIINSQAEIGGWPILRGARARRDTDGDGMPNDWERRRGLNPNDATDAWSDKDANGYGAIEDWMNALARQT